MVTVRLSENTEITVEEGGSVNLCAEIESPAMIDRQIFILGTLLQGSAEGVPSLMIPQ